MWLACIGEGVGRVGSPGELHFEIGLQKLTKMSGSVTNLSSNQLTLLQPCQMRVAFCTSLHCPYRNFKHKNQSSNELACAHHELQLPAYV